jgi:hypothetical protein
MRNLGERLKYTAAETRENRTRNAKKINQREHRKKPDRFCISSSSVENLSKSCKRQLEIIELAAMAM